MLMKNAFVAFFLSIFLFGFSAMAFAETSPDLVMEQAITQEQLEAIQDLLPSEDLSLADGNLYDILIRPRPCKCPNGKSAPNCIKC